MAGLCIEGAADCPTRLRCSPSSDAVEECSRDRLARGLRPSSFRCLLPLRSPSSSVPFRRLCCGLDGSDSCVPENENSLLWRTNATVRVLSESKHKYLVRFLSRNILGMLRVPSFCTLRRSKSSGARKCIGGARKSFHSK